MHDIEMRFVKNTISELTFKLNEFYAFSPNFVLLLPRSGVVGGQEPELVTFCWRLRWENKLSGVNLTLDVLFDKEELTCIIGILLIG